MSQLDLDFSRTALQAKLAGRHVVASISGGRDSGAMGLLLPDVACEACDGTGTNTDADEVYEGNCLECGGNGYKLQTKRRYRYAAPTYSRDRKGGGK